MSFEVGNLAEDYASAELAAFEAWNEAFLKKHPPPRKPGLKRLVSWEYWEFWALLVIAFSAVTLTSMRTAVRFYEAAYADMITVFANQSTAVILSSLEAIVSIVVVDLGLPVLAAVWAYRRLRRKATVNETLERGKMIIAGFILLIVVISAGLGQSIKVSELLLAQYGQDLNLVLVLALGGGIGIASYMLGDLIGASFAGVAVENADATTKYRESIVEYEEIRREEWEKSEQYNSLRKQFKSLEIAVRKSVQQPVQPPVQPVLNKNVEQSVNGNPNQVALTRQYLQDIKVMTLAELPTSRELAEELSAIHGFTFSTGSVHRGRQLYANEYLGVSL